MKGSIFLDARESQKRKNGFPLVCELRLGTRKKFSLKLNFKKEDWDFEKEEPKKDNRKILIIRKKKRLLEELLLKSLDDRTVTLEYVKDCLLGDGEVLNLSTDLDFIKFGRDLADELKGVKNQKGIEKTGTSIAINTALDQLVKFQKKVKFNDIDYRFLTEFKNHQLQKGNSKNTIHTYLRRYRRIFKEGVRRYNFKFESYPFDGVFNNVAVKQNRTKKRHLDKPTLKILENINCLPYAKQLAVDFYLLQFYFGGQEFIDLFYLQNNQINNNRVYFIRGKLDDSGYQFDLKINELAAKKLNRYIQPNKNFCFKFANEKSTYKTFIRRVQRNLVEVQENYNFHVSNLEKQTKNIYHKIEVMPLGGNLTTKVARHTFGTIGSRLFVEPDLLRSLMGHERDEVDTIYKDVYPEALRDEWHHKIIDTSSIVINKIYFVYVLSEIQNNKRKYTYRYFTNTPTKEELINKEGKVFRPYRYFKQISVIAK